MDFLKRNKNDTKETRSLQKLLNLFLFAHRNQQEKDLAFEKVFVFEPRDTQGKNFWHLALLYNQC